MKLQERNKLIISFFENLGFSNIRLIGRPEIPAIIFDNSTVLSCHIQDNNIFFTDLPKDGNIVFSYKIIELDNIIRESDINEIREKILNLEHRKCYRIKLSNNSKCLSFFSEYFPDENFYLHSYYFDEKRKLKFPSFLPVEECKLYFEREQAIDALNKIKTIFPNLDIEVI